jgi:hypothetical protein
LRPAAPQSPDVSSTTDPEEIMIIARKRLPGRTFLEVVGAAVALSIPDAKTPERFLNDIGGHMSQENITVINKIYEAFGQRNFAVVLEYFAPTIEWCDRPRW